MSKQLVAVVTGGSNGIGEGIVKHFAERGATVINVDVAKPADPLVAACPFLQVDLTDAKATKEAASRIAKDWPVNCVINNAGFPTPGFLEDVTDEHFDHGVNLHMRTPLILAQAFAPGMKARRFGRIVNISTRAILGKRARSVYSATKAALVGFTRTWAMELGPHGVTVNAIAPGPVLTELFKKNNPPEVAAKLVEHAFVGRAGTPEDIARAAYYFAEPANGYVTGQVLHVCGGSSLTLNW